MTLTEDQLRQIQNPTHRRILELRYIEGKRWREIADQMYYCERYTQKLANRALEQLKAGE